MKIFRITIILSLTASLFIGSSSAQTKVKKVLFDHDGGVDDLLSLLLLTQMGNIQLEGVIVTPADCFLEDATTSTLKILAMTGNKEVSVAQSLARPVNSFPNEWRAQPMVVNAFPSMLQTVENIDQVSELESYEFIAQKLRQSRDPMTILITGPCSNLVKTLEVYPELRSKVEEVVWMGGAVDVEGNVLTHKHAGVAEWNAYWDPNAAQSLFKMGLKVILIALDVTNKVPVQMSFLKQLAAQRNYPLSDLASQCWATTINTVPVYEYTYFMWDVLATTYLGIPSQFSLKKVELDVRTQVPYEGQTLRASGNDQWVHLAKDVNLDVFYDYLLGLLKR